MGLDDVRALVDALQRKLTYHGERIDDLEDENERLRERVAELESVVDPDPGRGEYDSLSKEQKVMKVRVAVASKAAESNGKAAMGYKDVYWLFDGNPSFGHCYDLMQRAAQLDGFGYESEPRKRITSNLDSVNDETVIHAVNKDIGGVGV